MTLGSIWDAFGMSVGSILNDFGSIWDDTGMVFGFILDDFGINLC